MCGFVEFQLGLKAGLGVAWNSCNNEQEMQNAEMEFVQQRLSTSIKKDE